MELPTSSSEFIVLALSLTPVAEKMWKFFKCVNLQDLSLKLQFERVFIDNTWLMKIDFDVVTICERYCSANGASPPMSPCSYSQLIVRV